MGCDSSGCGCGDGGVERREFLKLGGVATLTAMGGLARGAQAAAGPETSPAHESTIGLVPIEKNLPAPWLASLTERGERAVYRGEKLHLIGMPVGGVCAGQLYLGGDGRLWRWDIFNRHLPTGDRGYAHPPEPDFPIDQGFAIRVSRDAQSRGRSLDSRGFSDVRFNGEYPIGTVRYSDPNCPVTVLLRAFSPFIPLNTFDSSLPVTAMEYTVRNPGSDSVEIELVGWMQNGVCLYSNDQVAIARHSDVRPFGHGVIASFGARERKFTDGPVRPPTIFEDFEGPDYGKWKATGTAFGSGPAHGNLAPDQHISGFRGTGLVNTYAGSDEPRGTLTSPSFAIERPYISFLIGGGNHPGRTCMNLLVDGKVVRTATGRDSDALVWHNWNVRDLMGRTAELQIVDNDSGGWGHIDIDQIQFGDEPIAARSFADLPDFGTMTLAVLGTARDESVTGVLPAGEAMSVLFEPGVLRPVGAGGESAEGDHRRAMGRRFRLKPGESATVTFLIAWNFPNLPHPADPSRTAGNYYAKHFADAPAVIDYVAANWPRLSEQTLLWHRTWYDSTLPYWALDRTFLNSSILATSTCRRWRDGRFWCWEGVGCCIGTCTHVWHYAHAVARLFPDLERSTREIQDLDTGFDPSDGSIGMRGEFERLSATDGQTGTILRILREHQMSEDDDFLNRNWPRIRKAVEYLLGQDPKSSGVLSGRQPNTLDTSYFGPDSAISSLYVAALLAGERMATEVGDEPFVARLRPIIEAGRRHLVEMLWNGEYFVQLPDPKHPDALKTGRGSFIDQVFGQSWAWQVGLDRVLPKDKTVSALRSLWKYNFAPDVGPYRAVYKPGRWYAMPGEAGLIMCTWPHGGYEESRGRVNPGFAAYLNECMNGFEYQAAGHMIQEGLLTEGLAVTRALHDRYAPPKRNPWNEVECGDHYARSMASYGVFLALCGYAHHGPDGFLGFSPRISTENFRAPFTTAAGWGTYSQKREGTAQEHSIELRYGRLRLRRLRFETASGAASRQVTVSLDREPIVSNHSVNGESVEISFAEDVIVPAGRTLHVTIR